MGRWASPLTAPVFFPSPPSSPWDPHCSFPCCAVKISSSSPSGSSSRVAHLHFLPEVFISFGDVHIPFFFFLHPLISCSPLGLRSSFFFSSELEVFSCSSLGLGTTGNWSFFVPRRSPSFTKSENLHFQSLVLSGAWLFLLLPCLGW